MKILFSLLALVLFNKQCESTKKVDNTPTTVQAKDPNKVMQDNTQISYEANTRRFYEKIWITKDSITVTNDRNQKEKMSLPTPQKDWNELMAILNTVDIKTLPNLEAPTSMRQYDGAAIATLSVTQDTTEIKSNSFDHGHPPAAIETLVNKVLSMKELVKKQ